MYWLEVSVITDGEGAEAIADALKPFAYQESVVLEQLGDMEDLDPDALEPAVTVKIYAPEENDVPEFRHRIEEIIFQYGRLYPIPPPTFRKLEDQDWANAWKAHYHPFRIGSRIWIQPSWLEIEEASNNDDGIRSGDVVLTLDPGMAFGTGLHPTTQMCMRALEEIVQPGMTVLDVGTGSGILAIAAARLGAGRLLAFDTDVLAVKAAAENAVKNGVVEQISLFEGKLDRVSEKGWDVVVVNILAPVIINLLQNGGLLSYLADGANGRLILSGIVEEQGEEVETAVAEAGGCIVEKLQVRDWVSYIIKPC